jgi:hypothetical protein
MNNPDAKTAANTLAPAAPAIPVQQLIDSYKPETPLVIDSGAVSFGGAGSGAGAATTSSPSPVTAAPQ